MQCGCTVTRAVVAQNVAIASGVMLVLAAFVFLGHLWPLGPPAGIATTGPALRAGRSPP